MLGPRGFVSVIFTLLSMSERSDILLVGQTPPPFHGQAVVTGMLFDHDWKGLKVERLRMAFSDDMASVGEASWMKIWRLLVLVLKTWKVVFVHRPVILYYLPASPNMTPVIRDVIYLSLVRWMFPRTIFHYHAGGLDQFYSEKKWLRRLTQWVYMRADCSVDVNVTTPPSGEAFAARRNEVVMNGLDVGSACKKRRDESKLQVLYLGLLCEDKGVLEMVETARHLQGWGGAVEFVMVGAWESESFRACFETAASEAGVSDMFCFLGVQQGEAKWQAYADADVFIFPSHHPTETFGLVLIEAMAFGLPVITNRWRGIPHVVGEYEGAILCDPRSPMQYAEAIRGLSHDANRRKGLGRMSKERYMKHFTRGEFLKGMERVFGDVLAEEKGVAGN